MEKEEKFEQTAFEAEQGLRPRGEIEQNIPDLMKDIGECDFHRLYDLIWSISSKALLKRIADKEIIDLKKELEQLKESEKNGKNNEN